MKNTFDLYRCSPLLWAGLEYEDALHFRIEKAEEAKKYYRIKKDIDKYQDSEDAIEWNRKFLEEIKQEREKMKPQIEIVPDKIKNETRVLIWEGTTIVVNTLYKEMIEPTKENKEKMLNKYIYELTKDGM